MRLHAFKSREASGGRRRWGTALALTIALTLGAFVGVSVADHAPSNVTTYTACLSKSGTFYNVAPGDASKAPCKSGDSAVHLAAGLLQPQDVTVDCSAGQTVGEALETSPSVPLTITILGTCTEDVRISRDNVTLRGATSTDGLNAVSANSWVVSLENARGVHLESMTIRGGRIGVTANSSEVSAHGLQVTGTPEFGIWVSGSRANLWNTSVDGATGQGVTALEGGSVLMDGGTVSGSRMTGIVSDNGGSIRLIGVLVTGSGFHAVTAMHGGSVRMFNTTVEDNEGTGVFAFQGGSVHVGGGLVRNNRAGGVGANAGTADIHGGRVTGNPYGVFGYNGGHLTIQAGAVVDNNAGDGVQLSGGSTLAIQQATVTENEGNGIALSDTSVVVGSGDNIITNNGGWGVQCAPDPAVAMISGPLGAFSGNGAGDEDCPNA